MHTIIERELDLQLVLSPERSVTVPALLRYRSDDPFAVHVTFHLGSEAPVRWTFARDLLVEGLFRPSGQGDVLLWPARAEGRDVVWLSLRSPDGDALLRAPAAALSAWLERTMRLVPPGAETEQIDMDEALRALLTASPAEGSGDAAG
ncbi:SsgA family sporulation/cell division regulator [Streptomyces sp. NBC_01803]|uniref:SsgA family sporulation/cell division regulator n=1 Tax=Streptomyces sp. NBC_01803 TaxID=2975946 RepID=UPI002DDA0A0E|nr:SsgA family sporulation/cell division regulator [Streptomyces sp. NBC_01803]WSA44402.1 SsgA family sporulation/cell division regulator [Streptomyces sp. NBC_01803]